MARTTAIARLMMPEMNIQAPPTSARWTTAVPGRRHQRLGRDLAATLDYVNPEAPWPQVQTLGETCRAEGFTLAPRLPVYDEYIDRPGWLDEGMRRRVHSPTFEEGARHVG